MDGIVFVEIGVAAVAAAVGAILLASYVGDWWKGLPEDDD